MKRYLEVEKHTLKRHNVWWTERWRNTHNHWRKVKECLSWSAQTSYSIITMLSNVSAENCKTARFIGNYCSPQFWDVDKRCGAGDDSPRWWVWQEVERIRSCSAHLPICYSTVAFLGGSEKWSEGEKCDPPPCGGNCCNPCCRAFDRSCTNRSGWRSPWSIAHSQLEPCDKFAM